MNCEKVKIADICKYVTSGGTPLSSNEAYYNPPTIPWLKTKEVNYCRIYDTETYISQEGLDNSSAKLIPENSVIVAMYGQGDTAGRVAINKVPLATNQACCNLIIDENKADYRYIYYTLSALYDKLVSLKNGGAQPNLNALIIKNFEINIPRLLHQHHIADVLSNYDNLIENNQKQIKLLEEAAQRLYKEWFVDLRFPGHENTTITDGVPEGWRKTTIGEYLSVRSGFAFKSDWWQTKGYPVVKIKDIKNNTIDISSLECVSPEKTEATPEFKLSEGDSVIAMTGATIGKIGIVPKVENLYTNQRVGKIFPKDCIKNPTPFIFCFYSQKSVSEKIFALSSSSSAQPNISGKQLENLDIIANLEVVNLFCKQTISYFNKINCLREQISLLSQARDRLLPKLMSGEIEV